MIKRNLRRAMRQRGQAMIPVILIAFLAVGVIGIFAFEVCRAASIHEQLRTATEAAALAGSTELAGADELDVTTSQNNALKAAKELFHRNDIFGASLNNIEEDFQNEPATGHMKLRMQFVDPKRRNMVVPVGDPTGKVLMVETKYGMHPLFADYVGLAGTTLPVTAVAFGGVGDLDISLVFDISGSMDDQTKVSLVRRRFDPGSSKTVYEVQKNGTLTAIQAFLQACRPQQLNFGASGVNFNPALRGTTDNAQPGNFPPGSAGVFGFTDVVVNVDENDVFGGVNIDGFNFPNVATLVEASRGNLENDAVFTNSGAKSALQGLVTPKAGYQSEYFKLAAEHTHPLIEAKNASIEFFKLMNKNSNAHFSVVAFNQDVGTIENGTFQDSNVAATYPAGGIGKFAFPLIKLNQIESETNFDKVTNSVATFSCGGGTNIGGGTNTAIEQFTGNSRPNAKKVIVLFTDGAPTNGGPLSGDPRQNCILAAQKANQRGMAIYTVGLALDPALIPQQQQVLGDSTPQGMAKLAGNGGRFFQVTNAGNLRNAFASIARQLSQLVE